MRISDWSSDVCSSDLDEGFLQTIEINDITPGDAIGAGNGNARFTVGNQMITPTGHPQPLAGIDDIRRLKPIGFCKDFRASAGAVTHSAQRVPRTNNIAAFRNGAGVRYDLTCVDRKSTRLNSSH